MEKSANALHDKQGNPLGKTPSIPGWWVKDQEEPYPAKDLESLKQAGVRADIPSWGPTFSAPRTGNKVEFFTEGTKYFEDIAQRISIAQKTIFVSGWQINFDVQLTKDQTLFQCLKASLDKNKQLNVYVMPWMSPKVGVDTGDFETTLAILHLNAGCNGVRRAHVLPALQQSGLPGGLGAGFSHHQKLVVIDNTYAYVGGIDLAYGRRDDGRFSLEAGWRTGNELYNGCIPPIHDLSLGDQTTYLTRGELLAACSDDVGNRAAAWLLSAPAPWLAKVLDAKGALSSSIQDGKKILAEKWNSADLVPDFIRRLQDKAVDAAVEEAKLAWKSLPPEMRQTIGFLQQAGTASAADAGSAVVGWLYGANLAQLPPGYLHTAGGIFEALSMGALSVLADSAAKRKEIYPNLVKRSKMLPNGATEIDAAHQPRMPWHDVQCRIEGPSVFDLSMNFVQRWNSIGQLYERAYNTRIGSRARLINKFIPLDLKARVKAPRLEKANLPKETSAEGGVAIQVIRSAPAGLLQDMATAKEHATAKAGGDAYSAQGAPAKGAKQDNCLKAMLKAIHSAQHFLYIENQFFQSDFGAPGPVRSQTTGPLNQKLSGPMGALMSFHRSPAYRKFARQLGIEGLPADQILKHIKWSQVDDVLRDPAGRLFFKDLMDALKNLGMAEATQRMGPPQDHVMNPILQALVARIRKAIVEDGLPFHVYLVMPVHPEGTLHTPNVMHQVHLTMQAISHGHDSLLNGVRRAILERRKLKEQGLKPASPAAAAIRKELRGMELEQLGRAVGDAWKNHLTLLNLRNWASLGGRSVTEQIYVHSKTLIADDRVAILGSANINDRSQLGDRDSELAVIIRDTQQAQLALDGVHASPVSGCVSELRKNLWKKIFGLSGGDYPATDLKGVLDQPAAPATWKQIQQVAKDNAGHYEKAFWYIPRSVAHPQIQPPTSEDRTPPCSIWPTWRYHNSLKHQEGGRMRYRMPFEAAFWREVKVGEEANAWQVEGSAKQVGRAPEEAPKGIQGFIVELPIGWTQFEHNDSGQNLTLLAGLQGPVGIDGLEPPRLHLAQTKAPTEETPA